jgi:hypothetical protein
LIVVPEYAIFDIVMGSLYALIMVIEAYGVFAALKVPTTNILPIENSLT